MIDSYRATRRRSFIMALRRAGHTQAKIAERLGISTGRVQQIEAQGLRREKWIQPLASNLLDVEDGLVVLSKWKQAGNLRPYNIPTVLKTL